MKSQKIKCSFSRRRDVGACEQRFYECCKNAQNPKLPFEIKTKYPTFFVPLKKNSTKSILSRFFAPVCGKLEDEQPEVNFIELFYAMKVFNLSQPYLGLSEVMFFMSSQGGKTSDLRQLRRFDKVDFRFFLLR